MTRFAGIAKTTASVGAIDRLSNASAHSQHHRTSHGVHTQLLEMVEIRAEAVLLRERT